MAFPTPQHQVQTHHKAIIHPFNWIFQFSFLLVLALSTIRTHIHPLGSFLLTWPSCAPSYAL